MKYLKMMSLLLMTLVLVNCSKDEDDKPVPTADFQFVVNELSVTFNGTATDATSVKWDFGDNTTSTEQDPVHVYDAPGTYTVKFTATGEGGTDSQTKDVEPLASVEFLLTGGPGNVNGKTWKIDKIADFDNDGAGVVTNTLAIAQPIDDDDLMTRIGLPQTYEDTYTFKPNGSYVVDNSDFNGGSIMTFIYASLNYNMQAFPDGDLLGISADLPTVPLSDIVYTPKADASWSISYDDFDVQAINPLDASVYTETFTGKTHLVLDEYLAFKDASIVVIVKSITETHMNVALTLHGSMEAPSIATHLFHLTFVAQ
ncbi:MAG: PKD domain-containing protein [Bacteroidales bacterium]|nr:PKD domain-containing protein [Bacteroidales bacterium]